MFPQSLLLLLSLFCCSQLAHSYDGDTLALLPSSAARKTVIHDRSFAASLLPVLVIQSFPHDQTVSLPLRLFNTPLNPAIQ